MDDRVGALTSTRQPPAGSGLRAQNDLLSAVGTRRIDPRDPEKRAALASPQTPSGTTRDHSESPFRRPLTQTEMVTADAGRVR